MKIAMVVGEASGDFLAGNLIKALKQEYTDLQLIGIAGPDMQAQGMQSFFSYEKLSVVGLFDILHRLPNLLCERRRLTQFIIEQQPDLFIGVDAPDFNLDLEIKLKRAGIKVIHYVSPSIWAWRRWRWRKIKRALDHLLCLFPFEIEFYRQYGVKATCVGHPLANEIPIYSDKLLAREQLQLAPRRTTIAILPGSRLSEIKHLLSLFLQTAVICNKQKPKLQFVIAAANTKCHEMIAKLIDMFSEKLTIHLIAGQARTAMAAADVVLLSSGTATLECALIKRPMVVAYRLSYLNYHVGRLLQSGRFLALPNILANREIVPEFIQYDATTKNLSRALLDYLQHPEKAEKLQRYYLKMHQSLKLPTDVLCLKVIKQLLNHQDDVTCQS